MPNMQSFDKKLSKSNIIVPNKKLSKFSAKILPTNLFSVGYIQGIELYSSLQLRDEFIEIIRNENILKPVIKTLENLTLNWYIIPAYVSKNVISFLALKTFRYLESKFFGSYNEIAFYSSEVNRIYILFDQQVSGFFQYNTEFLVSTLIHELMHFSSVNLKSTFFNLFENLYIKWFKEFFKCFYKSNDISVSDVSKLPKFLVENCEWTSKIFEDANTTKKYRKIIREIISKTNQDIDKEENQFFTLLIEFFQDPKKFSVNINRQKHPYLDWFICCYEAYKKLGYDVDTLPGQEFVYVSEIACQTSEIKPSKNHYKAVKLLDYLPKFQKR